MSAARSNRAPRPARWAVRRKFLYIFSSTDGTAYRYVGRKERSAEESASAVVVGSCAMRRPPRTHRLWTISPYTCEKGRKARTAPCSPGGATVWPQPASSVSHGPARARWLSAQPRARPEVPEV